MNQIAAVLDFFSENNTAYIVMEYIGGETLSEYLAKKGRLSFREAFTVLRPVLEALGRLHEAGVVHGDVSPDNIILTDGGARLIDFGAAARSGVFEGTRKVTLKKRYAPPEQYNSGTVPGPRTDVYAAGVTLYYCVTASLPPESTARETRDLVRRPSDRRRAPRRYSERNQKHSKKQVKEIALEVIYRGRKYFLNTLLKYLTNR